MYEEVRPIDYDQPLIMRKHPASGAEIFAFRDELGVYRNVFGRQVSEDLARECGFDIEKHAKLRLRRERLGAAQEAIEADLARETKQSAVVAERNGYKVVDEGLGRHRVSDPDGNLLTPTLLTREQALSLLDKMA